MPGLGAMLLPGKVGFADEHAWRFNPSYLPPQLASYFTRFGAPWTTLRETNLRLLLESAPKGFSPDWVQYQKNRGWRLQQEKALVGGYDAIRVYLWVGMMSDNDPQKARLLTRFQPMAAKTNETGCAAGESGCGDGETHRATARSGSLPLHAAVFTTT